MLYMEIIAVCSEIHTKHANTGLKLDGMYNNHYAKSQY
jgi:hypothetical protein